MRVQLKLLSSWFRDSASKAQATTNGDQIYFPVVLPARIICSLGASLFGPFTAFFSIVPGSSALERGALALVTIWLLHDWPWCVVMDRDGISKRNYFGIKKVSRWPDVVALI
jgi:hypothetical protein